MNLAALLRQEAGLQTEEQVTKQASAGEQLSIYDLYQQAEAELPEDLKKQADLLVDLQIQNIKKEASLVKTASSTPRGQWTKNAHDRAQDLWNARVEYNYNKCFTDLCRAFEGDYLSFA